MSIAPAGCMMLSKLKMLSGGLHFRFLLLVFGLTSALLAGQLTVDTVTQTRNTSDQRLSEALDLTNVIARSLEGQFQYFDLTEIEAILASVRAKQDLLQITVVDRDRTFFLDGDPATSPVLAVTQDAVLDETLDGGKTAHRVLTREITVAEPLIQSGNVLGAVLIKFKVPTLAETVYGIIRSKLMAVIPILIIAGSMIWHACLYLFAYKEKRRATLNQEREATGTLGCVWCQKMF